MAKGAKPFMYRGKWRATVTLSNGKRPAQDFDRYDEGGRWIAEKLANANSEHAPELGGRTVATLADALGLYEQLYTINKRGAVSELNRINHYLKGAGSAALKRVPNDTEGHVLVEYARGPLPASWREHNDTRRAARSQTYIRIAELAQKRCSTVSTADLRPAPACWRCAGSRWTSMAESSCSHQSRGRLPFR